MPIIDVRGTNIYYQLEGPQEAPVVMFSNSLSSDLSIWDGQTAVLLAAGYRVLRYDSRGHGRSACPDGPYSIDLLAADAMGLLDALDLTDAAGEPASNLPFGKQRLLEIARALATEPSLLLLD